MGSSQHEISAPPSVRGWLLLLCGLLLVGQPVAIGLTASSVLDAVPLRGLQLALLLAARVLATGVGIAAGIAILRRGGHALAVAKTGLTLSAVVDVVVYATPYFPNNRPPGETPLYLTASLAYYAIWMTYLTRSQRVRRTLS